MSDSTNSNPHRDIGLDKSAPKDNDPVNHPQHYTSHPSGIECITITEHMGFNLGNAMKYIWRADLKGDSLEDLAKAAWYVNREIEKRKAASDKSLRAYIEKSDAKT